MNADEISKEWRWTLGGASALAVFALAVFVWFAAPGVSFKDSGLFALAIDSWGIPHPPGSPLYVLLAASFRDLLGIGDAARAGSLFSAVMGALSLGLLAMVSRPAVRALLPECSPLVCTLIAAAGALSLSASSAFLELSTSTEQYTLLAALFLAVALVGLHRISAVAPGWISAGVLGLLWGLSIANHLSQLALGAFVGAALLWPTRRRPASSLTHALAGAGGVAIGLTPYAWMLARSRQDPLLDWGNVDSWDRLMWALSRQQWEKRPLSEVPPGFVSEWVHSYGFASLPLTLLVVVMVGWLTLRTSVGRQLSLWLGLLVLPYAAGMFWGHLHQKGMGIDYIRNYGVGDFHLPVYIAFAILATVGLASLAGALQRQRPALLLPSSVALLAVMALALCVRTADVAKYGHPEEFRAALTEPLRAAGRDALVLSSSDTFTFAFGYAMLTDPPTSPTIRVAWPPFPLTKAVEARVASGAGWDRAALAEYLEAELGNPERHALRIPPITVGASDAVYAELDLVTTAGAAWLRPVGFLVRVEDRPTTDSEVVAADDAWLASSAPKGPASTDRVSMELQAWSELYERRGNFFRLRGMQDRAYWNFNRAMELHPERAAAVFRTGEALERLGRLEEAQPLYQRARELDPSMTGPRLLLALAAARRGDFSEAEALLVEELALAPNSPQVRSFLENVRRDARAQPR